MAWTVILQGGTPWGFRLHGGKDFNEPLRIAKINPNSKASNEGVNVGDHVASINGDRTAGLTHNEALQLIKNASDKLVLELESPRLQANGPINGHVPQTNGVHINGDKGNSQVKTYKPVSFTSNSPRGSSGTTPSFIMSTTTTTTSPTVTSQKTLNLTLNSEKAQASPPVTRNVKTVTKPACPYSQVAAAHARQVQPPPRIVLTPTEDICAPGSPTTHRNIATRSNHLQTKPWKPKPPGGSAESKGLAIFRSQQEKHVEPGEAKVKIEDEENTETVEGATQPRPISPGLRTSQFKLGSAGGSSPLSSIDDDVVRVTSERGVPLASTARVSLTTASPPARRSGTDSDTRNIRIWSPGQKLTMLKSEVEERNKKDQDGVESTVPVWSPMGTSTVTKKKKVPTATLR